MTVAEEREEGIVAVPNPFSPDGDGHEDVTVLSFHIPFRASAIRIRIFDSSGRVVRHLAEGDPSGSRGMVVWNGFDDRGERVRMGIYVVLIEARGMIASEFHELKGFVVAGYKM